MKDASLYAWCAAQTVPMTLAADMRRSGIIATENMVH